MKKTVFMAAIAALVLFACQKTEQAAPEEPDAPAQEEQVQDTTDGEFAVFTASVDGSVTKTSLEDDTEGKKVVWTAGDQINVNGTVLTLETENQPDGYGTGCTKGNFAGNKPSANGTGAKYKAVYPASLRDNHGYYNLPLAQTYVADNIASYPMYAESDEMSLSFKNLCGIVRINLKGEKSVSSISLSDQGPDPKPMSGRFNVVSDAAVPTSGADGTVLICETPVALNTSDFTSFFITVPAGEYGKLQILIEASDGTICTLKSKNPVEVKRSMITPINISSPNFKDETAQITYTTTNTTKPNVYAAGADASVFGDGLTVVSHTYDSDTKTGVITFSGTVTSIGYHAFRSNCGYIQTMTIPNTVTSIGERAFESCSNLISLNFPENLATIGTYAFANANKFVPDDMSHITTIYAGAFQATNLNGTLTLGNNFTRIDFDAFRNTKVTEVIIDHTPETLGTGVFLDCSKLTAVTFNDDIDIPNYMFKNCPLLNALTFNGAVTSIGEEAFNVCRGLTSLTLPSSLTSIGHSAFANCSGLETINFPANLSFIGRGAFAQCTSLEEIVLPANLATLNERENFSGCTSLTTVVFPANETFHTIPYLCFDGCTKLVNTSFPANITSIGQLAFRNCGFTALPEGWGRKEISYGDRPFDGCPIASITFPDDWTSVPNNFCWGWKSLQEVNFGSGVTSIGGSAFRECTALTDGSKVVIPAQVAQIGSYCFYQSGLTSLPSGINRSGINMDDHVFAKCPLVSVDISAWTTISQGCFQECPSLVSATLGNSLTTIGAYAFYSCSLFSSVTIPASVATIGNYCFANTALTDIPAGLHDCTMGEHIFEGTPMTSITMPAGMTTIPNNMFGSCSSLTTVNLNDVATVGNFAFSSCGLLSSVSAPNVVTVGENAFYRNYALVSIELPSVVTVKGNAFNEASHLETVDLGSHIASMGQDCFNNIQTMQAIYIRNSAAIVSLATRFTNYPAHPKPLIYVPQALLDSYKGHASWSQYKDYFVGLDIPVSMTPITSMKLGDGSVPYYTVQGILSAFGDNGGTLTLLEDITSELTFTGSATGVFDMNGHTTNKVFWMQNTGGSITIRNGTFTQTGDCFDGKTGFNDGYGGTVILENMTVNGILWTDSHPFIIRSGDYKEVRNMKRNDVTSAGSGTITIEGGRFKKFYDYTTKDWTLGTYTISGGKFAFDPTAAASSYSAANTAIALGYSVQPNTDSDSGTYPYIVEPE